MLDLALVSGKSPLRLLDDGLPDTWTELDLEILSQWKHIKDDTCPGCGRPIAQHLYNSRLGREETADDYTAWTLDCPAMQAISTGQEMWKKSKDSEIKAHHKGTAPDPGMGVYWLAQGQGERLPTPDKP